MFYFYEISRTGIFIEVRDHQELVGGRNGGLLLNDF